MDGTIAEGEEKEKINFRPFHSFGATPYSKLE